MCLQLKSVSINNNASPIYFSALGIIPITLIASQNSLCIPDIVGILQVAALLGTVYALKNCRVC